MLGTAIIPKCYGMWLPAEAMAIFWQNAVIPQEAQDPLALGRRDLVDPLSESPVYIDKLTAAFRMFDDNRMGG